MVVFKRNASLIFIYLPISNTLFMKKLFFLIVFAVFSLATFAQTIVGTTPENKNVVLEEFTGIHCGYCPQGHAIANQILAAHPDDVMLINIHQGSYATPSAGEPDFRTIFGNAIAGQSGLTGYPAGTVNRHVFAGLGMGTNTTAMGRGNWSNAANQILAMSSYVNVGVEAEIDVATRVLTVHVEAYYTANSPVSTNKLNVVLLQDNTLGPQSGGGAGNNYNHMHRLVWMLTEQWGEEITTTTSGTFVDRTYTYTIPADYNGVGAELADLHVVAFITESNQEIITGNKCETDFVGFAVNNDAAVEEIITPSENCGEVITPAVKVRNLGGDPITSLTITTTVNGGTVSTTNWTGEISPLHVTEITLEDVMYTPAASNEIVVTITTSDENNDNNSLTTTFGQAESFETSIVTVEIKTDAYGSESSWKMFDANGSVIAQSTTMGNNTVYTTDVTVTNGCYEFVMYDSYGDGILAPGYIKLFDAAGTLMKQIPGAFGSQANYPFAIGEITAPAPIVSINILENATNVDVTANIVITFNQAVRNLDDSEITNENVANLISLTSAAKADVAFTATINEAKTEIVVDPTENLPASSNTTLVVGSVENSDDVPTSELTLNFVTGNAVGVSEINNANLSVYPNPFSSNVTINFTTETAEVATFNVYNVAGVLVYTREMNVESGNQSIQFNANGLEAGFYFFNLKVGTQETTQKVSLIK